MARVVAQPVLSIQPVPCWCALDGHQAQQWRRVGARVVADGRGSEEEA